MIEQKRGVTVSDSGSSEVKVTSSMTNGLSSEASHTASGPVPAAKSSSSSSSWDEDWGPKSKSRSKSTPESFPQLDVLKPAPSMPPSSQAATSYSGSVDFEWPPRSIDSQSDKNSKEVTPPGGFEDVDPFADWPPRPSTNPLQVNGSSGSKSTTINFFNSSAPLDQPKSHPYTLPSTNSPSIGFIGVNGNRAPSMGSSSEKKDLGSIFSSSGNDQSTMRIAPPPITAIGRGRGRSQGRLVPPPVSRPVQSNPSDRPPLLDLL